MGPFDVHSTTSQAPCGRPNSNTAGHGSQSGPLNGDQRKYSEDHDCTHVHIGFLRALKDVLDGCRGIGFAGLGRGRCWQAPLRFLAVTSCRPLVVP